MRKLAVLLSVVMAACGSVGSPDTDAAPGNPDGAAGAVDATPGSADASTAGLTVTITAPATFSAGVCSAPGVFKFKVDGGPAGGTFDWNGVVSDGDLVPANGAGLALDGTGAASVDLSICTPVMGPTQMITITVTPSGGGTPASDDVTIALS